MLFAVLRAIFYVLLIQLVWGLIRQAVGGAARVAGGRHARPRVISGQMVKDPVCGTYVVQGSAIVEGSGRSATYFCSEECRRRFRIARP